MINPGFALNSFKFMHFKLQVTVKGENVSFIKKNVSFI